MSFYLRPPKGLANVNNLETTIRQRVICYDKLCSRENEKEIQELECLVEDSILDRLGHYLFRLLALKNRSFLSPFINNEKSLLKFRLDCYSKQDVKYFINKLKKHSITCLKTVEVDGPAKQLFIVLIRVCTQFLKGNFLNHCFAHEAANYNQHHELQIKVPFEFCPDLLATRKYEIVSGQLQIECFQWKQLLLSLFETYLQLALKEMKCMTNVHKAFEDERITDALFLANTLHSKNYVKETCQRTFKLEDFDNEITKFPLCMMNLHKLLMKNNRLGHNARFDFSLYLKSIGLSVMDSLTFWKSSYSKQHTACSKCSHNWNDNEKRYNYGIRHLYGLEGSRKNYSVKACCHIQSMTLGANEEGGCPFQHFDDENLRLLLKECLPFSSDDQIGVIIYKRKRNSKRSCELFLNECLEKSFNKDVPVEKIAFQDPAEYYLLLKSLVQ